jgi:hypothetical protein
MIWRSLRALSVAATIFMAVAFLPLFAQSARQSLAVTRITKLVDENHLITLQGNVHPLAQARFDRGPAPSSMSMGRLLLVLQPSAAQQQALTDYLTALVSPASPSYRKWLTPAQFGATYGLTDDDLQTVKNWLQSHGLKIERVPQARNVIEFSGTVDQVEGAFRTSIHSFQVNGEQHYANVSDPQIPEALAPVVAGAGPLNDFRPRPQAQLSGTAHYDASTRSIRPQMTLFGSNNLPYLWLDPADAATIYDTPNANLNPNYNGTTYDGAGVNIGIAGDSNVTMQDIQNYRVAFLGETAATANLPTVVVDGNDPGLNGDEVEALLDTEIAGGIAPKATIYLYTSDGGLGSSMVRALDDNIVSILNISFSGCEQAQGNSGNAFLMAWAEQAAAQGISVTVATGDYGSAGCDGPPHTEAEGGLAVNGIASTPWTIAVGGTDFDTLPANFSTYVTTGSEGSAPYYRTAKSYIPETPWNDSTTVNTSISANIPYKNLSGITNIIAAGGGASSCVSQSPSGSCLGGYLKPSFQTSLTPNDNVRDLPDVSLFSSNGFDQAVWTVCADNVANEDMSSTYTDCQTTNGQLTSSSTFSGYGGTSTSAPAFAGMLALVSQAQGSARLGQADFVLYQLAKSKYATVFHDTVTGDNSVVCVSGSPNCGSNGFMTGYNAIAGYDLATGLGSVDVAAMVKNWSSVSLASTSTTLNINGSTAALTGVHGAPLAFNVAVTPTSASGVAGIVDTANESSGGSLLNGQFAIPLSDGSGSANYNGLPGGTYTVAARYGGDTSDAASTSAPINVTISPENSASAISGVGCFPPPLSTLCIGLSTGGGNLSLPYGSEIGFQAEISGTSADELKNGMQGVATGTVTFASGSTVLGTVPVGVDNQVPWPILSTANPYIPAGSYNITAQYSGDASFHPAVSPAIALTITRGMASTNVSATNTSIPWSGSTIVTVDVDSLAAAVPTGNVTLTANGSTLATITNFTQLIPYADIEGTATIQASQLAVGANIITATYSGDSNYNASSATVTVTVNSTPPIGFTLGNSGNIAITPGQFAGNSTITVTPAGGFTGQVNLACAITTSPGALTAVPLTCNVAPSVNITTASAAATPLTISAPSNTLAGAYVVSVSGTNAVTGVVMARTTVNVTVGPSYGFAINNSGDTSIDDGNVITDYVQIAFTAFGGFTGNINTTCTIKPVVPNPAVPPTCTFPSSVVIVPPAVIVATLYVNTTSSTTPGTYVFTVTGTDAATGTVTASTSVNVTLLAYNQGYTLSNSGNISLASASSVATSTITVTPFGGFTGQVDLTGASLYLGGSSVHNAVQVSSTNGVTGVHVSTTLNVSAPSGVDFNWTVTSPVTITGTSPATATLTVTAVSITAPSFGFTLGSSGNISVNPGATSGNTATIAVSSTGGFSGQVNLGCAVTTNISNPVDLPTCSIPAAVNILSGSSGASTVLTVTTTAASSATNGAPAKKFFLPGGAVALGLVIFPVIPARRRRWITMLGLFAVIVVSVGLGCGGSSSGPTPPQGGGGTTAGAYIVTVTATDGATGKLNAGATVDVSVM